MKVKIRLDTMSDIKKFVSIASGIVDDIQLTDGNNLIVNAKSILGALYSIEWSEIYCTCDRNIYYSIQDFVSEE